MQIFPLFLLVIGGFAVLGVMIENKSMPDTVVVKGNKLTDKQRTIISGIVPLLEKEEILFFYSTGFLDYEAGGSVVTNQRLVSFEKIQEEMVIEQATYEEVVDISPELSDNWVDDSSIHVRTDPPENSFIMLFGTDEGGDQAVLKYLESRCKVITD